MSLLPVISESATSRRPCRARLASWLSAASLSALLGCATGSPAARPEADLARQVESLRAQNAAYARKVEELENQIFVLNGELDARRPGEPAPAAAVVPPPPPPLPEIKLARGERAPEADGSDRPQSLVEDAAIEYAGAAAERSSKRPMLRLWGTEADASESVIEPPPSAPPPATSRRQANATPAAAITRRASPPVSTSTSTSAPAPIPSTSAAARNEGSMGLYQVGIDHLHAGRHDEAVVAFRGFVKAHPGHDYADNAQYWLGECFYDRKEYSTALREFRKVAEKFPLGNKVPDAMLKVAFSYLALGSARPAREALHEIVRSWPRLPAAALARAKLAELDGAGGAGGATGSVGSAGRDSSTLTTTAPTGPQKEIR